VRGPATFGAVSPFDALFAVQEQDSATDRLVRQREALPERPELGAVEGELAVAEAELLATRGRRDDVAARERRLGDEAESTEQRAREVEKRLYSGEVSSPRELQAMQTDVEQLRRRCRDIEDRQLVAMEEREAVDADVAVIQARFDALEQRATVLRDAIADQERRIDTELGEAAARRRDAAAPLDAKLLREYERCREQARGIGIARLVGLTCQGCHLTIPSTEAERIRKQPPDAVAHCDNCGCILVAS